MNTSTIVILFTIVIFLQLSIVTVIVVLSLSTIIVSSLFIVTAKEPLSLASEEDLVVKKVEERFTVMVIFNLVITTNFAKVKRKMLAKLYRYMARPDAVLALLDLIRAV